MTLNLTGLKLENYKRITLAEVTFDPATGGVVALMGPNEAGKSSMLDAFEALIAGRKAPKVSKPIHTGADSARIVATFDDSDGSKLIVTRQYTQNGKTSIVVHQDGLQVAKADEILSRLYSHVALDPLAFANLPSKEQVETLVKLIGFDPAKLDTEAANVFATRTEVGQQIKSLTGQLSGFPIENSALANDPLVDIAAVQDQLESVREQNTAFADFLRRVEDSERWIVGLQESIEASEESLAGMRKTLAEREQALQTLRDGGKDISLLPVDDYLDRIRTADETNRQIREAQAREKVAAELAAAEAVRQNHTDRLEEIRAEKAASFAAAADRMPIPGLTVEDGEVYLDGTPFSQTSAGGKLRTSTAIAMALNPELRAIVIRDGSLLDAKNRAVIDALAKANDFTVLMEIVDENAPSGIVFEDGTIKAVRA